MKAQEILWSGVLLCTFNLQSQAQLVQVDVSVDGRTQPWLPSVNPSRDFGNHLGLAPMVIDLSSFLSFPDAPPLSINSIGGIVSARPDTYPYADANGLQSHITNDSSGSIFNGHPSKHMSYDWDMYLTQLVGTFADNAGVIVGNPFELGTAKRNLSIPAGATKLQLGINDDRYEDNDGFFNVRVSQLIVPIVATWEPKAATRNWSEMGPSNWTTSQFPQNGAGGNPPNFEAIIGGALPHPLLDIDVTIDKLTIGATGGLDIAAGRTLTLVTVGVTNDAFINLHGGEVVLPAASQINGSGEISGSNSTQNRVLAAGSTVTHGADHTMRGALKLLDNTGTLINHGTIIADQSQGITVELNAPGQHHGTFRASGVGKLDIRTNMSGSGQWLADGGQIEIADAVQVTTSGPVAVSTGGDLIVGAGARINGAQVALDESSEVTVESGGRISTVDRFEFATTSQADWNWHSKSSLEISGGAGAVVGDPAGWATLEIGGLDQGDISTGHFNNFGLPELVIGPGARVALTDLIDNGNQGGPVGNAEALYVGQITFADATGVLDLGGFNAYYQFLNGGLSQIVGGTLDRTPIISIWQPPGVNHNWNQSGNWSSVFFPQNGAPPAQPGEEPADYEVIITPIAPAELNITATVNTLTIENGATLNIRGSQDLTIAAGMLDNDGRLVINSTNSPNVTRLIFSNNAALSGKGEIYLNRGAGVSQIGSVVNRR